MVDFERLSYSKSNKLVEDFSFSIWTWVQLPSPPHLFIFNLKTIKTGHYRRPFIPQKKAPSARINEAIFAPTVRVIDETGGQLGIMETKEAIALAQEHGLDLVEVAPLAKPPVCKIIDWGKYQYQLSKKDKDSKKNQVRTDIKGVRIRPNIGENDLNFKIKQTEKFLSQGDKVKIEILMRGREKAFSAQARQNLQVFIDKIKFSFKIEQAISKKFNGFNVIISPDAKKDQATVK